MNDDQLNDAPQGAEPTEPPESPETIDTTPAPGPAVPPRIVAETPLGGKMPLSRRPLPEGEVTHRQLFGTPPEESDQPDEVAESVPTPEPELPPLDAEAATEVTLEPFAPEQADEVATSAAPETEAADSVPVLETEPLTVDTEAAEIEPAAPETEAADAVLAEITPASEAVEPAPESAAPETEPAALEPADSPAPSAEPAAPISRVRTRSDEEAAADAEKSGGWDDDLSPELAAVLFGQRQPASRPTAAAPQEAAPPVRAALAARVDAPRDRSESVERAESSTEPVQLTDLATARRLPLAAQEHRAPAPEAALAGKVRYSRVEEPYKGDRGQRIAEAWRYFKPEYPALGGRLVRGVRSEEIRYADGSWSWHYERSYTDGGRDRREVRANTDATYIERDDELSVIDTATSKRTKRRERIGLIFAAPEREEKRGLLSSLLGRDDDSASDKPEWRPATSGEARHVRRQGGAALKRGLF